MVIIVKNLQKRIPLRLKTQLKIKKAVLKTLSLKGRKYRGEITVCLVNDAVIKEVNLQYLGENYPTDVIAFDLSPKKKNEAPRAKARGFPERNTEAVSHSIRTLKGAILRPRMYKLFADIIISTDTALANARRFKTTPLNELYMYVIHGVLHLLGYEHKNKKAQRIIDKKTSQILKIL